MACNTFGLECHVFMVRVSYLQKPYRRVMMQTFGADVEPSPSAKTELGRGFLEADSDAPGSLGIAVSEAVETAVRSDGEIKIAIGSALSPVLMHQTVIGLEALEQFEMAGEYPDVLIGCVGAGSNFGGFCFPFMYHNRIHGTHSRVIAVEPAACPTLTRGYYGFDYADASGMAPLVKMHTLGHDFIPPGIHAGGLRYHGMAPQVSVLYEQGEIEAVAVPQVATFQAAVRFDSRGPKVFCRHRKVPMLYKWQSPRPCGAGRRARRKSSHSICQGMDTSISRRMTRSAKEVSRTSSFQRTRSRIPGICCRRLGLRSEVWPAINGTRCS